MIKARKKRGEVGKEFVLIVLTRTEITFLGNAHTLCKNVQTFTSGKSFSRTPTLFSGAHFYGDINIDRGERERSAAAC